MPLPARPVLRVSVPFPGEDDMLVRPEGANPAMNNLLPATPQCVQYESEWARLPNPLETPAFDGAGVTAPQVQWWPQVAQAQALVASLVAGERLPLNGIVFHYRPLEFAQWINEVTRRTRPKSKITDAAGNPVARPRGLAPAGCSRLRRRRILRTCG
jgi:hypothetical protein